MTFHPTRGMVMAAGLGLRMRPLTNDRPKPLIEVEGRDRQFDEVFRQGTEVHAADVAAIVAEGIADGTIRDEDPLLLAYGVVGAVGYYGHFHRTGRVQLGVDELAAFVGRFVVGALASDEAIAHRVLAVRLG